MLPLILTAYEVVGATNQILELTSKFCDKFKYKILAFVPSDERLMHSRVSTVGAKGNAVIAAMRNQNAFLGDKINCEQDLNLGFYQSELPKVKAA
ncbi:hypothetical protein NOVO_08405 [Rickettsiales bacterium Ac37b]|nr:hypothetical protein NOVO_08405 [Rickettsiales bacterium Ac37b]